MQKVFKKIKTNKCRWRIKRINWRSDYIIMTTAYLAISLLKQSIIPYKQLKIFLSDKFVLDVVSGKKTGFCNRNNY